MNKIDKIIEYLNELYPNPRCELNYNKDYELLIAVVLSAQTTDKRVNQVTPILFSKYPSLKDLKEADIEELYAILRPIGMYRKKALFVNEIASTLHDEYKGRVINDRKVLENISGVGRKSANVLMAELFKGPYIAVDTHVSRVSKRLGLVSENDNVLQIEKKLTKLIDESLLPKIHHQLVLFGRYHCKAIKPNCDNCKLRSICNYKKEE